MTVNLSQIDRNTSSGGPASGAGGIYAIPGSPVTLTLTLIAKNTPDNCEPLGSISGCKS